MSLLNFRPNNSPSWGSSNLDTVHTKVFSSENGDLSICISVFYSHWSAWKRLAFSSIENTLISKTLLKVSSTLKTRRATVSVWTVKNGAIWKRWRHSHHLKSILFRLAQIVYLHHCLDGQKRCKRGFRYDKKRSVSETRNCGRCLK